MKTQGAPMNSENTSENTLPEDELSLLQTFFRQMELGRIAEWSGLAHMDRDEFCGWMVMVYSMLQKDPQMRERMKRVGAVHLENLKDLDQKWVESLMSSSNHGF